MGGAREGETPWPKSGSVSKQRWFSEVVLEGQAGEVEGRGFGWREQRIGIRGRRLQEGPSWSREGVNETRVSPTCIEVLSKAGSKGTAENGPEGCAAGHLGRCCGTVPIPACAHTSMLLWRLALR